MPNGEKEIDRIIEIIKTLSKVETKLHDLCNQYRIDFDETKKMIQELREDKIKLEERIETLEDLFLRLKLDHDKMKWIWGSVAAIISPIVTAILILCLQKII